MARLCSSGRGQLFAGDATALACAYQGSMHARVALAGLGRSATVVSATTSGLRRNPRARACGLRGAGLLVWPLEGKEQVGVAWGDAVFAGE